MKARKTYLTPATKMLVVDPTLLTDPSITVDGEGSGTTFDPTPGDGDDMAAKRLTNVNVWDE